MTHLRTSVISQVPFQAPLFLLVRMHYLDNLVHDTRIAQGRCISQTVFLPAENLA